MRPALLLLLLLTLTRAAAAATPTVALVIDDLGYSREGARRALALPPPVTVAILPYAPYTRAIARAARRSGTGVLVHMPMETLDGAAPPHALLASMSDQRLRSGIRRAIAAVPGAIGVNNHEGSGLTARRPAMDIVMDELAGLERPMLFVDSRTTAATTAEAAARAAGVGVARRNVFLDHRMDPDAIAAATDAWLDRARRTGCALAIGHPHPATLRVLERVLPRADDVDRVDLPTFIQRCGTPAGRAATIHVSAPSAGTLAKKADRPN